MQVRIECTDHRGQKSYLTKANRSVGYYSAFGLPYALSNLFGGKAMLAEFAISDAADADETLRAVLEHAPRYRSGPNDGKTTYSFEIVGGAKPAKADDLRAALLAADRLTMAKAVTTMLAALIDAAGLIDEAMTVHIYDADQGEAPGPDCRYAAGLAKIRAAIAAAKGESI